MPTKKHGTKRRPGASGMFSLPNLLDPASGLTVPDLPRGKRIVITQEVIDQAEIGDSGHCMIAEAVKLAIQGSRAVMVDLQGIRYSLPKDGVRVMHLTPPVAQDALLAFDEGKHIKPFWFRLGPAAWVTKLGVAIERDERRELKRKKQKRPVSSSRYAALTDANNNKLVVTGNANAVAVTNRLPRRGMRRAFGLRGYGGSRIEVRSR